MVKKMIDSQRENTAKELQRQDLKEWRSKNRDRVKIYNERYWQKKARRKEEAENVEENA